MIPPKILTTLTINFDPDSADHVDDADNTDHVGVADDADNDDDVDVVDNVDDDDDVDDNVTMQTTIPT